MKRFGERFVRAFNAHKNDPTVYRELGPEETPVEIVSTAGEDRVRAASLFAAGVYPVETERTWDGVRVVYGLPSGVSLR